MWKNELKNLIIGMDKFEEYTNIRNMNRDDTKKGEKMFPVMVTPYYAKLLSRLGEGHPLLNCIIPSPLEVGSMDSLPDFKKEEEFSHGIKGLRIELQGRATIITTHFCPNHCRYCFRKYYVNNGGNTLGINDIDRIIEYARKDASLTEWCLSGGEPLVLNDELLDYLLTELSKISHIKVVRIFTRAFAVLPSRFTLRLLEILKKFPTLYMIAHFDHEDELTDETIKACRLLADNGVPIFSSTVLLKNVNDSADVLGRLFEKCVQNKIKPLYLYHCVPAMGVKHFMTPVELGTNIIEELYSKLSALCVPLYTVPLLGEKALAMPCMKNKYENKI